MIVASLLVSLVTASTPGAANGVPWEPAQGGWRNDPAWYDGKAEVCVYEATRTIYGLSRPYLATAYTNKQRMDPERTVKSDSQGIEVFKHHWSERVPTENYDYDFSTASFVECDDLRPFKLTASSQDDCGSSFKQLWRQRGQMLWLESCYFPGTGLAQGELGGLDLQFFDALPLVLRDFPFEAAQAEGHPDRRFALRLVPSQKEARSTPCAPRDFELAYGGLEELELPVGSLAAHRLELLDAGGQRVARYWFAAEQGAPWLRALVRYEGPLGTSYRLKELRRWAYWER